MKEMVEQLQSQLGRKLKEEEVQFLEWLNKRMEQEEEKKTAVKRTYMNEPPPYVLK